MKTMKRFSTLFVIFIAFMNLGGCDDIIDEFMNLGGCDDIIDEFGERVATGIYFYQLQANNMSLLRKMVSLK